MKTNKVLKTHTFNLSPNENSGEGLTITTEFIANGDDITETEGVILNHEITLQSYGNSASINLFGIALTPEKLRTLANQLERERNTLVK